MDKNDLNIALAWYRQNQWGLLVEYSTDSKDLESTYQKWLEQAEEKVNEMKKNGIVVVKVDIDVEALKKWCKESGRPVDGSARSEYAAYLAQNNKNILG